MRTTCIYAQTQAKSQIQTQTQTIPASILAFGVSFTRLRLDPLVDPFMTSVPSAPLPSPSSSVSFPVPVFSFTAILIAPVGAVCNVTLFSASLSCPFSFFSSFSFSFSFSVGASFSVFATAVGGVVVKQKSVVATDDSAVEIIIQSWLSLSPLLLWMVGPRQKGGIVGEEIFFSRAAGVELAEAAAITSWTRASRLDCIYACSVCVRKRTYKTQRATASASRIESKFERERQHLA